jgi:hypothetical protein
MIGLMRKPMHIYLTNEDSSPIKSLVPAVEFSPRLLAMVSLVVARPEGVAPAFDGFGEGYRGFAHDSIRYSVFGLLVGELQILAPKVGRPWQELLGHILYCFKHAPQLSILRVGTSPRNDGCADRKSVVSSLISIYFLPSGGTAVNFDLGLITELELLILVSRTIALRQDFNGQVMLDGLRSPRRGYPLYCCSYCSMFSNLDWPESPVSKLP